MAVEIRYWGPPDLYKVVLRNAARYLRMVDGRPYQLQWRGVALATSACKQVGVDISKAVGSELYPNIKAARKIIDKAINDLPQKGDK